MQPAELLENCTAPGKRLAEVLSALQCLEQLALHREGAWGRKGRCAGNPVSSLDRYSCGELGDIVVATAPGRLCRRRAHINIFPQNWMRSQSVSSDNRWDVGFSSERSSCRKRQKSE